MPELGLPVKVGSSSASSDRVLFLVVSGNMKVYSELLFIIVTVGVN